MSRDIHFRGRQLENGEWAYGSLVIREQDVHGTPGYFIQAFGGLWQEVEPDSVGQYAGHGSIDGELVYEGDWLQFPSGDMPSQVIWNNLEGAWELHYDGHSWAKIGMVALMKLGEAPKHANQ